jgi:hypothetical protein
MDLTLYLMKEAKNYLLSSNGSAFKNELICLWGDFSEEY